MPTAVQHDFPDEIKYQRKESQSAVALPQIAKSAIDIVKQEQDPKPNVVQKHSREVLLLKTVSDASAPSSVRDLVNNLTVFKNFNFGKVEAYGFSFTNSGGFRKLNVKRELTSLTVQDEKRTIAYPLDSESSRNIFSYNNDPYSLVIREENKITYLKIFANKNGSRGFYGWVIHSPYSNPQVVPLASLDMNTAKALARAPANASMYPRPGAIVGYLHALPEL